MHNFIFEFGRENAQNYIPIDTFVFISVLAYNFTQFSLVPLQTRTSNALVPHKSYHRFKGAFGKAAMHDDPRVTPVK